MFSSDKMQRMSQLSLRVGSLPKSPLSSQSLRSTRSICFTAPLKSQNNPDKAASESENKTDASKQHPKFEDSKQQEIAKSMAQEDDELRKRLEEMSGEGGASGIEYEDGKPQAMKRSVRNNMFRYI
ncbi:hypothetical protein BJX70DRAFT_368583 [Aspergillus crustosus]